jgi:hypothetical protein
MHNKTLLMAGFFVDQKKHICYTSNIMQPIQFVIPPVRPRRHRALFDNDLPFRGRVQRPKTVYQRRPKHRHQEQQ